MRSRQTAINEKPFYGRHHEHMLWVTRLLSLAPGVSYLAMQLFGEISTLSRGGTFQLQWIDLIPLVMLVAGAVAWRWHRIGGVLLILSACGIIGIVVYDVASYQGPGNFGFIFYNFYMLVPYALIFIAAGVLNIVYWYIEKKPRSA